MVRLLEQAFSQAAKLPTAVQKQLAEQLMDDIQGEKKWDETLANSQDLLESLAAKARGAKLQRKTVRKGFDEL